MIGKYINIIIISLVLSTIVSSQNGAHVKAGFLLVGLSNNEFSFRPGLNLGIQGKLGSPGFYMSHGLFLQKFTISEYNKTEYMNNRPSYYIVKLNTDGGIEKNILSFINSQNKFLKSFKVRVFTGVNLNYVKSIDKNPNNINFNDVYDLFVGYDYGLGFSAWFLTIDFKQERSLTEFYKGIKKTYLNFSTISVGFVF
jgi:hypothetical protein